MKARISAMYSYANLATRQSWQILAGSVSSAPLDSYSLKMAESNPILCYSPLQKQGTVALKIQPGLVWFQAANASDYCQALGTS